MNHIRRLLSVIKYYHTVILAGMIIFVFPVFSYGQLSGTYTIGQGGTYATFSSAAQALHNQGVNGPVVFNVLPGTFTEQFILDYIPNASETNAILFQSQSGDPAEVTVQYDATVSDSNYVVTLKQCRDVTFRAITFKALNPVNSRIILMEDYGINITIENNVFVGDYNTNAADSKALIYAENVAIKNLKIINNRFNKGSYGIFINSNTKYNQYPELSHNCFDSLGYCAIFCMVTEKPIISYNTINYSQFGLCLSNASNTTTIRSNKLTNIFWIGMQLYGLHSAQGFESTISNNMVAANQNGHYGIEIQSSDYLNIVNNTVLVNQDYYDCRALSIDYCTGSTIKILNNNLVNKKNGYAIFVGHTSDVLYCDYNNYYTPGRMFAWWHGGGPCEDFHRLKTVSQDNEHSVSAYPYFMSDTDLHARSAWLDGAGIPVSGISKDIDGEVRDAGHPDIGADEFTASNAVQPPLSGTKTIGIGGDYSDLKDAIRDAQIKGVSDTLKLKIFNGNYDGHYVISPVPGAGSKHPVIIESFSGNAGDVHLRYDAGSNEENFIFKLYGSSFFHFRNLTLDGNGENNCRVFDLRGMVDSLHIESCRINGSTQNDINSMAILINSEDYNLHSLFVENNIFGYCRTGILLNCPQTLSVPGTFYLLNNRFFNIAYQPVYLSAVSFPVIVNNRMESNQYGMFIAYAKTGLKIENNYILAPYGRGIGVHQCWLSQISPGLIDNNFIACNHDFINKDAFRLYSCDTIDIYYNSISVKNSDYNDYVPFECQESKGIDFENNIISTQGTKYSVFVRNSTFSSADYNCYYGQGTQLGYWDQVCSDLEAIRNASGMNAYSIFANPVFASDTDLHVSSGYLDSAGTFIGGIYFDYDGDPRDPQYPDIGADEFGTPPANHPPVAMNDTGSVMSGQKEEFRVLANDYDPDHESVQLLRLIPPVHGIANVSADSTAVIYRADVDFTGPDSMKYFITDPRGATDSAMIYVEVTRLIAFAHVSTIFDSISHGVGIWGDYDGDGDLDLLLAGIVGKEHTGLSKIYRNTDDTFILQQTLTDIIPGNASAVAWGDFDNDGDPDLVITGYEDNTEQSIILYQNNHGHFDQVATELPGVDYGSVAWGDYDNDGDLDLALSGYIGSNHFIANIYRNDGQGNGNKWNFTETNTLTGGSHSTMAWADYDGDGDLDILVSGSPSFNTARLYQNVNGIFTQVYTDFAGIAGQAAWNDYDNDGDPDLLLAGYVTTNHSFVTKIFRNESNPSHTAFADIHAGIIGVDDGAVTWGDYDNDGDADICITGKDTSNTPVSLIYRNDGNDTFTGTDRILPGVAFSSVSFGDYNSDKKTDLLLTGYQYDPDHDPFTIWNRYTGLFKNIISATNALPRAPQGLQSEVTDTSVVLSWHRTTDQETPSAGLSYNLRVGTTPGGAEVVSAMANADGTRDIVSSGNVGEDTTLYLTHLQPGAVYYWSVQAIDPSFAGSPFSSEEIFSTVSPYFSEVAADLPGVTLGEVAWGDYDNDGDLDLAMSGRTGQSGFLTRIYRNDEGTFTDIEAGLQAAEYSSLAWGDYDNDGDIDLLLFGDTRSAYTGKIYRNDDNGVFTDSQVALPEVSMGDAAWGDYDNDGDLDILVTGWYNKPVTEILRNDKGTFSVVEADLPGVYNSSAAWCDYDKDGDMDILLTGYHVGEMNAFIAAIFNNDNGVFSENTTLQLPGVRSGAVAWGDYDSDGYPDLLLTGEHPDGTTAVMPVSMIFHNDRHGNFVDIHAALDSVYNSSVAWGDVDNDGDLDIILSGDRKPGLNNIPISEIYLNGNGNFSKVNRYLPGLDHGSVAVGDYDHDGGLDFVLTGADASQMPVCKLFHNNNKTPNQAPDAPRYIVAHNTASALAFQWEVATDQETQQAGLSYNLRIGTTPGGSEVMSAMADTVTGFRKVTREGNVNQKHSWKISGLEYGKTYYFSVQAIDNNFQGSPFVPERSVTRLHVHAVSGEIYTSDEIPVNRSTVFAFWKNEQDVPVYSSYHPLGETSHYIFNEFPEGYITIRANPDTTEYPDYLPTYLGNTVVYSEAASFYLDKDTSGVDIYLVHKPSVTYGTSMIDGSLVISQGQGKGTIRAEEGKNTEVGTPLQDVWVYLLNNKGKITGYDVTDLQGKFHFDSIPSGHYNFYADYRGWPMDVLNDSIRIDEENHCYFISAIAVDTIITVTISDITLVNDHKTGHRIAVFPNPVKGNMLYVRFDNMSGGYVQIRLTGMDGRVHRTVHYEDVSGGRVVTLPAGDLPPGVYILSVDGEKTVYRTRIVKIR